MATVNQAVSPLLGVGAGAAVAAAGAAGAAAAGAAVAASADDVVVSAGTLVTKSIRKRGVYTANLPVQPHAEWVRNFAHLRHLDALADKLRALEERTSQ